MSRTALTLMAAPGTTGKVDGGAALSRGLLFVALLQPTGMNVLRLRVGLPEWQVLLIAIAFSIPFAMGTKWLFDLHMAKPDSHMVKPKPKPKPSSGRPVKPKKT